MGKISVIIPAYNGVSRFLEEAIRSVLAQTYRDTELIVVDDASTDDTAHLVSRFSQACYFRLPINGGQAAARNEGAKLATGEYLAFLDQDDLWEPTILEETATLLASHPHAAVAHCDGYKINRQNVVVGYYGAIMHSNSITQILRGGHDVVTSGSLFRKTCFDSVGGYDDGLAIWEDIDLAIRLYQRYAVIHHPKPLYRRRLYYPHHASNSIPSERQLVGRRLFLEKHGVSCPPGTREARALSHDWSRYYGDLGKHHLCQGQPALARQAFWQSIRYSPFELKPFLRLLRSCVARKGSGLVEGTDCGSH